MIKILLDLRSSGVYKNVVRCLSIQQCCHFQRFDYYDNRHACNDLLFWKHVFCSFCVHQNTYGFNLLSFIGNPKPEELSSNAKSAPNVGIVVSEWQVSTRTVTDLSDARETRIFVKYSNLLKHLLILLRRNLYRL